MNLSQINSLDDFLVDNEYVYLVYGRTERCSLVDFLLDETGKTVKGENGFLFWDKKMDKK